MITLCSTYDQFFTIQQTIETGCRGPEPPIYHSVNNQSLAIHDLLIGLREHPSEITTLKDHCLSLEEKAIFFPCTSRSVTLETLWDRLAGITATMAGIGILHAIGLLTRKYNIPVETVQGPSMQQFTGQAQKFVQLIVFRDENLQGLWNTDFKPLEFECQRTVRDLMGFLSVTPKLLSTQDRLNFAAKFTQTAAASMHYAYLTGVATTAQIATSGHPISERL